MADRTGIVAGALLPGMPHLLAEHPAPSWSALAGAARDVGARLRRLEPDVVLLLSTQWFTVLGHQFQCDPNPRGEHVDENWYAYDYGLLDYDLRFDVDFTERWADRVQAGGMQARRTRYDGFPIDTGTIVTSALLDPDRRLRWAQVSCNLYADADTLADVGRAGAAAARDAGLRAAVVVVTGMSSGLIQQWIEPGQDRIGEPGHDQWNTRVLDLLTAGKVDEVLAVREDFARQAQADSQFRALAFAAGAEATTGPAHLHAYGPIWGTGAAVLSWNLPDHP
ncbi:2-amino-5-chlorophenol 1,6-dioxygenase subunit alpha [Micromonospora rosaria]|uniref:2-amino-5-chlorophenol 1,6-dioxygenase subunit alpha n=1 Tax=Micromonospora rosaria TaxID=47874 RepID=A0A136PV43_9ACTN|nr:2-amino-5-chlorophenol 1,6-dioxygenase subunit alpha [Micromonospora rosaria]7TXY_A Chain A, 2-amino-5-chlorophenol 1,6-dioxygenase subunit alpha [Micromonospora rosaria]7TXY_C Chain C, 2-amino-5-chlorophenol 1,6-dioxygenase subunit alpha [Micromonospora rosaria]7TXY_E Chain E, 2-amino-5-chlorophenol 1,6-dioxygenase subunit alpha [Micromonospora rosaria]7TXY_G Chain G, 2-amino-5-chlorophenol 1,6-dioxygenase subunit alpha [Micromonospora rosaria]KXK62036.1 2-amino-5-chlorophenol 1,6-dioxygen